MTLLTATFMLAGVFLVLGGLFASRAEFFEKAIKALPRSQIATVLMFGAGAAWFLSIIVHLGEADFGAYRQWLFLLFLVVAMGAFFVVPDFLAVRGLSILTLLSARPLLDAAYLQLPSSRLVFVSLVYVLIVLALYLAAMPYRWRDFFNWLYTSTMRPRALGCLLIVCAAGLALAATLY
ncbi:MAG TPA: hypothetical protein DIU37_03540 [Opitutae bacterium]|nr:hypothetical protein [Opitutae bacterium]